MNFKYFQFLGVLCFILAWIGNIHLHDRVNTNGIKLSVTLSSPITIYRDYFES